MPKEKRMLSMWTDVGCEYDRFIKEFSFTVETRRQFEIMKNLLTHSEFSAIRDLMPVEDLLEHLIFFKLNNHILSLKRYIDDVLERKIDNEIYGRLIKYIVELGD